MNIRATEVFNYLGDEELIEMASSYPRQFIDMCTLVALDIQLEKEKQTFKN